MTQTPTATRSDSGRTVNSLTAHMRHLLLNCASRQKLFEQVVHICREQFQAAIARVDFRDGGSSHTLLHHDTAMPRHLAERFNAEYLNPLGEDVGKAKGPNPSYHRYRRGNQEMTLVGCPIFDVTSQNCVGSILLLMTGTITAESILPRVDAIAAFAAAALTAWEKQHMNASASGASNCDPDIDQAGSLNALAKAARYETSTEFAFVIVNSLCRQLRSEQVSLGLESGQRIRVEAISGVTVVQHSTPGIDQLTQVMEECLDHGDVLIAGPEMEGTSRPLHLRWARENDDSSVCSIPLRNGDEICGVITIRRPGVLPFSDEDVDRLKQSLQPFGAAIRVLDRANRPVHRRLVSSISDTARKMVAPGSAGKRILMGGLLLLGLWVAFGSLTYRPILRSRVTSASMRHFSAPYAGQLYAVHVSPGQQVSQGDLLAELDTRHLRLQYNSLERQVRAADVEVRRAMVEDRLDEAAMARSRRRVHSAQLQSIRRQIEDSFIRAPADGVVVVGDLQHRVGQTFAEGDPLFQFATDGDWLLEIEIPDSVISYVNQKQTGVFSASSSPDRRQPCTVSSVDGAATVVEDRNVFIARAPLESHPEWMRSGMEGTVQLTTVQRPVWWIAFHGVVDWARTNFWI